MRGSTMLQVELADGRRLQVPLSLYPTLRQAAPAVRGRWEWIGRGYGIHWPDLDLDLSVSGLLAGVPEVRPVVSRRRAG
ncbi:MAG: DUF2442 domain-containing protein [Phycisphaerales bacterium]